MKLLMILNVDWAFISHRLPIAEAAAEAGWDVHIATTLTEHSAKLDAYDFTIHGAPINRGSWNPLELAKALAKYWSIIRAVRPDVVHLVTIKPVLLGGLAARLLRVPGVVFAVAGLGHVFIARSMLGKVRRTLVRTLYRLAMSRGNKVVIFQNSQDEAELVGLGCVRDDEVMRLPGSGFDVDQFEVSEIPSGRPVFLLASRLIKTKGVMEFANAAAMLRGEGLEAEFLLVGSPDTENPEGLSSRELDALRAYGAVKVLGHRDDVPELMRAAWVVVLPSYYGEGLPKVLIEAAAVGRAVITTDSPGCRDAIEDGVTGLLVPERDVPALASAMRTFAKDKAMVEEFGLRGRRRAESMFRIQDIVAQHLEAYDLLSRVARPR